MNGAHKTIPLLRPFVSREAIQLSSETLLSNWIGAGPKVAQFENAIAAIIQNPRFSALSSGTAALSIAYELAHVGPGSEVITSPLTCLATTVPILARGGIPVWADITDSGTIDPTAVATLVNERTRAIVAVHFGGQPCDLAALRTIATKSRIPLIEDAAHAFGARYLGRPIGEASQFCCFSFQSVKSLTTVDGGGIAVDDDAVHRLLRLKRWFGIDRANRMSGDVNVSEIGYKYEMHDVAASIGLGNIPYFQPHIQHRASLACAYRRGFAGLDGVALPLVIPGATSSDWLFPVLVHDRDSFAAHLAAHGIETGPVHCRNDVVRLFDGIPKRELPVMSRWASNMTCLPIGHWVTQKDVDFIIATVKEGW